MKILLIGATGMVGTRLLTEARSRGHDVEAAARNVAALPGGLALDASDAAAVTAAAQGVEVIISAVSPRSTPDAMSEAREVAAAEIAAAKATGARLVVVGGAGTSLFPDGSPVIDKIDPIYKTEASALKAVRDDLAASGVDWTFVTPPFVIAPGVRTGAYRTGGQTVVMAADGQSHISAEDFAVALLDFVEQGTYRGQLISVGT